MKHYIRNLQFYYCLLYTSDAADDMQSIESKTNFFEKRVSEYALADKTDDNAFEFTMDF